MPNSVPASLRCPPLKAWDKINQKKQATFQFVTPKPKAKSGASAFLAQLRQQIGARTPANVAGTRNSIFGPTFRPSSRYSSSSSSAPPPPPSQPEPTPFMSRKRKAHRVCTKVEANKTLKADAQKEAAKPSKK